MLNAINKQYLKISVTALALYALGGCTDGDERTLSQIAGALRSGLAQSNQEFYQRPDWKAEEYFTDPKIIDLCHAISKRDLPLIDKLIADGVDVNAIGKENMTPLRWAFVQGRPWHTPPSYSDQNKPGFTEKWSTEEFDATHLAIFTKLLEHGADPNINQMQESVAHLTFPYFEVVMKNGGNPHWVSKDYYQNTLVHTVATCGIDSSKKLQLLIDAEVDLNQYDNPGMTPLMRAVSSGSYDPAITLVEAGADWEKPVRNSVDTVLHIILDEDVPAMEGVTPDSKLFGEESYASYLKLIEVLEEKGADFSEARADQELFRSDKWLYTPGLKERREQLVKERHERYEQKKRLKAEKEER